MRWMELSLSAPGDELDALCAQLADLGVDGVSIENEADFKDFLEKNRQYWDYVDDTLRERFAGVSRVKFYLSDDPGGRAQLAEIEKALGRKPQCTFLQDEDWENGWKSYYEPLPVGEKLLIVPAWMEAEPAGRTELRLDPGIAFGTGSHPTTRMCLQALEAYAGPGKTVLDLGCGSGILSIAALLLGCDGATACDIDPKSPDAARRNAALNGVAEEQYRLCVGDVLSDEGMRRYLGGGFDIVLANIVADVILSLSSFVRRFMARNAVLICSGIIDDRAAEVENALKRNGFTVLRHLHEEEWHAFVCQ
ncbi:MAG: 50S ribosomal protein L11 methyltransferase [Oscillospiraceae bacterium]|nr:50S ribosomal protein L11 methyltransferase [Oscillospiraceae bacterium]